MSLIFYPRSCKGSQINQLMAGKDNRVKFLGANGSFSPIGRKEHSCYIVSFFPSNFHFSIFSLISFQLVGRSPAAPLQASLGNPGEGFCRQLWLGDHRLVRLGLGDGSSSIICHFDTSSTTPPPALDRMKKMLEDLKNCMLWDDLLKYKLTRPSILCVTHQMMNYKWYLMVLGQYMTILTGTWSV